MSIFKKKQQVSTHAAINYRGKLLGQDTPFAITESFKTLRTNLMYTTGHVKCPVYGVTSSYQNSGKRIDRLFPLFCIVNPPGIPNGDAAVRNRRLAQQLRTAVKARWAFPGFSRPSRRFSQHRR